MQFFLRIENVSGKTHRVITLVLRRATVDDLPALKSLWLAARLPADALETRLTEFQIVENRGVFAGAIGVQIVRQHARIYAEDFTDFSVADAAREMFGERLEKIAANHGVFRLWTQETSPFWTHWGYHPPNPETLARLPDEWKSLEGRWLTLELKNEDAINTALENQFAGFMAAEKKQTARVSEKARTLKTIFTVVFFAIAAACFAVLIYILIYRHPFSR